MLYAWVCRCQMFKSKDVKQMQLVIPQISDDVFLLCGGGMAALVKGIGFKVGAASRVLLQQRVINWDDILTKIFAGY